jgi:RNA polymerase II subunit A-like phosphatase
MIARNSLALEAQVEERPLAKLQEELQEAADGQLASESLGSNTSGQSEKNTSKPSEAPGEHHHRKALLKNDDIELQRIKRVSRFLFRQVSILTAFQLLDDVHQQFFEAYDNRPPDKGGKAKALNKARPSSSILYDVRVSTITTSITRRDFRLLLLLLLLRRSLFPGFGYRRLMACIYSSPA